mgnify:CR=1 FL=1
MQQQRDNAMNDVVNARAELILLRQENAELKKQLEILKDKVRDNGSYKQ